MEQQLQRDGWSLSEKGIQYCKNICVGNSPLKADIIRNALNTDIREIGKQVLPADIQKGKITEISGPIVLQIQKIRNISAPSIKEDSSAAPRMLRILLTDGVINCTAIETEPLQCISLSTAPGSKVCLTGNITIQNGLLLLGANNLKCLGGQVEHLKSKWELSKNVSKLQRKVLTAEGGPPLFVPYDETSFANRKPLPFTAVQKKEPMVKTSQKARQSGYQEKKSNQPEERTIWKNEEKPKRKTESKESPREIRVHDNKTGHEEPTKLAKKIQNKKDEGSHIENKTRFDRSLKTSTQSQASDNAKSDPPPRTEHSRQESREEPDSNYRTADGRKAEARANTRRAQNIPNAEKKHDVKSNDRSKRYDPRDQDIENVADSFKTKMRIHEPKEMENVRGRSSYSENRDKSYNERQGKSFDEKGGKYIKEKDREYLKEKGGQFYNEKRGQTFDKKGDQSSHEKGGQLVNDKTGQSYNDKRGESFKEMGGLSYDEKRGQPSDKNRKGGKSFDEKRGQSVSIQREQSYDGRRGESFIEKGGHSQSEKRGQSFDKKSRQFFSEKDGKSFGGKGGQSYKEKRGKPCNEKSKPVLNEEKGKTYNRGKNFAEERRQSSNEEPGQKSYNYRQGGARSIGKPNNERIPERADQHPGSDRVTDNSRAGKRGNDKENSHGKSEGMNYQTGIKDTIRKETKRYQDRNYHSQSNKTSSDSQRKSTGSYKPAEDQLKDTPKKDTPEFSANNAKRDVEEDFHDHSNQRKVSPFIPETASTDSVPGRMVSRGRGYLMENPADITFKQKSMENATTHQPPALQAKMQHYPQTAYTHPHQLLNSNGQLLYMPTYSHDPYQNAFSSQGYQAAYNQDYQQGQRLRAPPGLHLTNQFQTPSTQAFYLQNTSNQGLQHIHSQAFNSQDFTMGGQPRPRVRHDVYRP